MSNWNPTETLRRTAVFARRVGAVSLARLTGGLPPGKYPDVDEATFRRDVSAMIESAPPGLLRSHAIVHLPGNRPPWFDTGLDLVEGEQVTWLASGRVYLSGLLDIFVEPHFQLWGRIGTGPVFNGARATHTFRVDRPGRLDLASYFPGEWADPSGRLGTSPAEYAAIEGGMTVAILRWQVEPLEGLESLARSATAHPLVALEIDRLSNPVPPPRGWQLLWYLGESEIYRDATGEGGEAEIACHTHGDVGILRKDLDVPLEPTTRLAWSWKVDSLPSALAEDTLPTHDYLSIAVEFENGIDVTYHWSAELAPETGYWCPLPSWKDREFHVAIRSGTADLGRWIGEERNLHEDYARFVGEPVPRRIRRVWLIANSMFQRGDGRCAYRKIRLREPEREHLVL